MKHVLIVKLGALGDIVMATPLLTALHAAYPGVRITWVAETVHADILRGHPLVTQVIGIDSDRWRRYWRELRLFPALLWRAKLRRAIEEAGPVDALLCFHAAEWWWLPLLPIAQRVRVGIWKTPETDRVLRRFYHKTVTRPFVAEEPRRKLHSTAHFLLAARALDCPDLDPALSLGETDDEAPFLREFWARHEIGRDRPLIVLAPFTTWATKEWEPERWSALIDRLWQTHRATIVITLSPRDKEAAQAIVDRVAEEAARAAVILAVGTTLRQYVALLRRADLVVCCDSSGLHIAAAVQTPYVALFGPTSPEEIAPLNVPRRGLTLNNPPSCAPCRRQQCDNAEFRACMKRITAVEVFSAVDTALAAWKPDGAANKEPITYA